MSGRVVRHYDDDDGGLREGGLCPWKHAEHVT